MFDYKNYLENKEIYIDNDSETCSVDLSELDKLEEFYGTYSSIEEISLGPKNINLQVISMDGLYVNDIDLEFCPHLKKFYADEMNFPMVDLSFNKELEEFSATYNHFNKIDFSNNLLLTCVWLNYSEYLEEIDLSKHKSLVELHCISCPCLKKILLNSSVKDTLELECGDVEIVWVND